MKLIVMLISLSVHYGPATISGFDTLAGCRAAEPIVIAFYKKTTTSDCKDRVRRATQVAVNKRQSIYSPT